MMNSKVEFSSFENYKRKLEKIYVFEKKFNFKKWYFSAADNKTSELTAKEDETAPLDENQQEQKEKEQVKMIFLGNLKISY